MIGLMSIKPATESEIRVGFKRHIITRAGFSWWKAWGPAIGVGDGEQRVDSPPPKKKNPGKNFQANIM